MGEPMNEMAFRPDPEMFVCMDPTGCYHLSWNAEQHAAKMAQVGAKHEARYLAASPSPSEMDCDPDGCKAHIDAFMQRAEIAEAQVLRLTEENEALERHNQALLDKVSSEDCACAYDGPDDVCLGHSPKLRAAEARIKALEEALRPFAAVADALPEDQFANSYTPSGKDVLPSMRSFRTARSAIGGNAL